MPKHKPKVENQGKKFTVQPGSSQTLLDKKSPTNTDIMAALKMIYEAIK